MGSSISWCVFAAAAVGPRISFGIEAFISFGERWLSGCFRWICYRRCSAYHSVERKDAYESCCAHARVIVFPPTDGATDGLILLLLLHLLPRCNKVKLWMCQIQEQRWFNVRYVENRQPPHKDLQNCSACTTEKPPSAGLPCGQSFGSWNSPSATTQLSRPRLGYPSLVDILAAWLEKPAWVPHGSRFLHLTCRFQVRASISDQEPNPNGIRTRSLVSLSTCAQTAREPLQEGSTQMPGYRAQKRP